MLLALGGLDIMVDMSAFFEKYRNDYYELLMKVSENGA